MLKDAQCSLHTVCLLSLLKNSLPTLVTFTMHIALRNLPKAFRSSWNIQFSWFQSAHWVRTFWTTKLVVGWVNLQIRASQFVQCFGIHVWSCTLHWGEQLVHCPTRCCHWKNNILSRKSSWNVLCPPIRHCSGMKFRTLLVYKFIYYTAVLCLVQDDTLQEWPYGGMFWFGFVGIDRTSILLSSRSYVLVDYIFNDKPQVDSCKVLLLHFHHVLQPPLLHLLWYDGCCPHAKPPDCRNCRLGFLLHLQPLLGFSHFQTCKYTSSFQNELNDENDINLHTLHVRYVCLMWPLFLVGHLYLNDIWQS